MTMLVTNGSPLESSLSVTSRSNATGSELLSPSMLVARFVHMYASAMPTSAPIRTHCQRLNRSIPIRLVTPFTVDVLPAKRLPYQDPKVEPRERPVLTQVSLDCHVEIKSFIERRCNMMFKRM